MNEHNSHILIFKKGAPGEKGAKGAPGYAGRDGSDGVKGEVGEDGYPGVPGIQGTFRIYSLQMNKGESKSVCSLLKYDTNFPINGKAQFHRIAFQ